MEQPNWVDVATFLVVAGGAVVGLGQYIIAERWRRREFIAGKVREFEQDPMVANVFRMLDWNARSVKLFPEQDEYKKRFANVDDAKLAHALESEDAIIMKSFDHVDAAIRDNFDCFLGYLDRFNQSIDAQLIKPKELLPYLRYWINLIGRNDGPHKRKETMVIDKLWRYIDTYGYRDTQRFLGKYGFSITPVSRSPSSARTGPPSPRARTAKDPRI